MQDCYEEQLTAMFRWFLQDTKEDLEGALDAQAKKNYARMNQEQERTQLIIDNKQRAAEVLVKRIKTMRNHKQTRTLRLFSVFKNQQNRLKLRRSLNGWISFRQNRVKKNKIKIFIANFHRRGILMRVCKGWKHETQTVHRGNVNQATMKRILSEVKSATQKALSENELLKAMVRELTEDLRNETIAKNSMKYRFEQALLRGMSALNMEHINIHQEIISQARAFTDTSRSLLYTPDKLGYLTRS